MGLLELFGFGKRKEMMIDAIKKGAMVVDVRSHGEYQGGHVKGSKNIPLDMISKRIGELKSAGKPIVFCCASGMRSGIATNEAKAAGIEAYNGGGWMSLNGVMASI